MTPAAEAALANIRELWAALTIIRCAVEDCAPPGSAANAEYLLPEPAFEAEALVRGIMSSPRAIHLDMTVYTVLYLAGESDTVNLPAVARDAKRLWTYAECMGASASRFFSEPL